MADVNEGLPGWATERVEVVEHDPRWVRRGAHEARILDRLLAPWLTQPVEHVGSTAVPGLAAKPVVDLQAAVRDLDPADVVAATLAPHGWHLVPAELDRRGWRRFYVKVSDGRRAAHLHLMVGGSDRWQAQMDFRDALRADDTLAARYASLKRDLCAHHPTDREAYTSGKGAFVHRVLVEFRAR